MSTVNAIESSTMLLCVSLLLSLLCHQIKSEAITGSQICVCDYNSPEMGPPEPLSCCDHYNKTCYPESNFGKDHINNFSSIALCELNFVLNHTIKIENLRNVSLTGHENKTNITCHREGGIRIIASRSIEVRNIRLIKCGALYNSTSVDRQTGRGFLKSVSSLHITNSTEVRIDNVSILNGNGTGLIMVNSYGSVSQCEFHANKIEDHLNLPGGGGMYVEFNSRMNEASLSYLTVRRCNFSHNEAVSVSEKMAGYQYSRCNSDLNAFGRGGGLALFLTGDVKGTTVELADVEMRKNKAIWGGGVYIKFCQLAKENQLLLTNVEFHENMCELYGGGGVDIGFTLLYHLFMSQTADNSINFENCTFQYNRAFFGGGLALYSTEADIELNNSVTFLNCSWIENTAYYGAALDIAPQLKATPVHGDQPKITLNDATFTRNTLIKSTPKDMQNKDDTLRKRLGSSRGTFIIAGQTIFFEGSVEFRDNTGSAIYAISSILEFTKGSKASFTNNSGLNGGAIALIGYSALSMNNNVTVSMVNNSAALGGAIFHESFDKHDYLFSHNCFIQGENSSGVFLFADNMAGNTFTDHNGTKVMHGNDMYITTLLPCIEYCGHSGNHPKTPSKIFNCIGDLQFDNEDEAVATSGAYFLNNISQPLHFISGKRTQIPFLLLDDLNHTVHGIYHITSKNSIYIDDVNTYTSENVITLNGEPGTAGNITITKIGPREITLSIEIILEECPPFFLYDDHLKLCQCAVEKTSKYKNIHFCDKRTFESELLHGYWVGYKHNETAENFMYGICPSKFCFDGQEGDRYHKLPSNKEVEDVVCGETRTGILCGQCRSGFCVYYHSPNFICGNCTECENGVGWVLYIVSELLPLTLLFTIIILFNISFTSGYLSGFILFSQVFDSVFSNGEGFILFPRPVYKVTRVILVVYKLFNFDFLGDDKLAFCFWKEAKTIHLLSIKFITVVFAAILITTTVLLMKRCAYSKRLLCCSKSASMIHGLSAFLVMVYTQCTNISFQLLNYVLISDLHGNSRKVLFYQGNIELFSKEHAPFALLAILCLSTLTLIPPLFLISYPLCYRVAALLRLDNTTVSKVLGKMCPISKLKPIFDSFQGCFKDNYRHFAGLYFVYRVGLLASVLTSDPIVTYTFTQVQLSLILAIHCICWPYIKRIHNIIDALVFFNLSIINIITVLNYSYGQDGSIYQSTIDVSTYTQVLFISAPIVYLMAYTLFSIVKLCLARIKIANSATAGVEDEVIMERLGSSDEDISKNYNKLDL